MNKFFIKERGISIKPVSYTHLRAHETSTDLVCRLLLEKGTYELILSSPGVERSLKTKRHFELALNEEIKINLIIPKNGEYTFIGNFVSINEKDVEILNDGLTHNFGYENIKKANIRFNKFRQKVKN